MISTFLKEFVNKSLGIFGLQVHGKSAVPRRSFVEALQHASNLGLLPATVLDVGAAYGTFTVECHNIFPESRYLLIEPLQEYKSYLDKVIKAVPKAEYILSAAAAKRGEVNINVHPDLVGSSTYLEREGSDVNGVPRTVPAETLDNLCEDKNASGPYLVKVDVQGAELDVLSGATKVLNETEYLILEVSLFEFFEGGPQFYDVVHYMKSCGFVVYDIFGLQYRPLDNAMSQVDMAFVRDKSQFRKYHFYGTKKQREEQTKRFLELRNRGFYDDER